MAGPPGANKSQDAVATPDFASVSVMLHVTVWEAADTLIAFGTSVSPVRAGGTVSESDVTVSVDGKPDEGRSIDVVFPTASSAETLAVQTPAGEYRGKVITHDQTPFRAVPDVGVVASQLSSTNAPGGVKPHEALVTPERLSVNVMVQVTFAGPAVVLTAFGTKVNAVRTGAAVSQTAKAGLAEKAVSSDRTANPTRIT